MDSSSDAQSLYSRSSFKRQERRKQENRQDCTMDAILTQKILTLTISGREGKEGLI